MFNYHQLQIPKKMGVKLLYPRRRSLIFKMLAFCTFLGFVGLWYKAEEPEIDTPPDLEPRKDLNQDGLNGHIPDPGIGKFQRPADPLDHAAPVLPVNNRIDQAPPVEPPGVPAPILQPQRFNPPNVNLPSPVDQAERIRAELMFAEDEMKVVRGLGEGGKSVKLSGEEQKVAQEVMKKEAFNLILSDKISVNRSVPDSRDPL